MNSIDIRYLTRVGLIWAGCFALFFFVYMLVLAPQEKNKEQLRKQLKEKKQMYDTALKATQKEAQDQLSEQTGQLRNRLKDFVIDFEDTANLTFDISQIAGEKAVTSFSIETKKDSEGEQSTSDKYIFESGIRISFLTESFNQFAALLNALERHQPVIFVDRFVITRADKSGSGNQVRMNLSVFVRKTQNS
jgi:hypothetical protein